VPSLSFDRSDPDFSPLAVIPVFPNALHELHCLGVCRGEKNCVMKVFVVFGLNFEINVWFSLTWRAIILTS